MDKLKMHTPNLVDGNIAKIAALFPNAVTEVRENGETKLAIDFDVLRQELSEDVVEGAQERYQFTWPDKKKSVVLANQPIAKTLRLDREKSVGKDGTPGSIDTENIYIEGDNLDALKLLQETYLGKVKLIYIDPPYNTGSDAFVYDDDFTSTGGEFSEASGQRDEDGNLLFDMRVNNENNGRFHTDWLNMLYPRLRLAKDLLSEDGVLIVSISDAEFHNLKKILDEIFGASNYCGDILWNSTKSVTNTALISVSHTYNLVYFKSMEYFVEHRMEFRLPDEGEGFENPDNDPRGPWKADPFQVGGWRPNQQYDIVNPNTGVVYRPNPGSSWKNDYKHFQELLADNRIVFGKTGDSGPQRKRFLWEATERGKVTKTWWDDVETTTNGTQLIKKMFDGVTVFSNPKPVELLKRMIQLAANKDSVILDFFSGSATTAHACMQLNAEDGGHRKFIMVQVNEETGADTESHKAGWLTIPQIGEERIRRAGKKIKEEAPLTTGDLDIGFRVFRVDTTNMEDIYYRPADYNQGQMQLFANNIKADRTPEDLLFQVMLDLGILLSSDIEETEIAGKKVFSVAGGYLIACFDSDVTENTVKAIAQKHPFYAVFRDSGMASDSVATNFEQIFETYSPKTQRKVL